MAPTGYWDDPVNLVKPGQAELLFIAHFDWNQMDYIDLRYYPVKIASEYTGVELLADEETVEAVSRARSEGSAALQCGKRFEPREAGSRIVASKK